MPTNNGDCYNVAWTVTNTSTTFSDNYTLVTGNTWDDAWCNDCTAADTALSTNVWHRWVARVTWVNEEIPAAPTTPEQVEEARIALERRRQEFRERETQRLKDDEARRARGRALLESLLDKKQKEEMEKKRYIPLTVEGGGKPARHYRIHTGMGVAGNIEQLDKPGGKVLEKWCVHNRAEHNLPQEDHFVSQLLHLKHDDDELRRTANVHAVA